jgi:ABC-type lipoprotein release transport system permease subunit
MTTLMQNVKFALRLLRKSPGFACVAVVIMATLAGIGIGLIAAFALGRVANSLIYGVSSRDLATFLVVTMLLIVVSFGASLIPALRATRVDPLAVLREE